MVAPPLEWPSLGPTSRLNIVRQTRDVWAWNFNEELDELLTAVWRERCAVIALDTEFPGFLCREPARAAPEVRYAALQMNVDQLSPIQLGLAVAGSGGVLRGAWNFNISFDLSSCLYTEEAVSFLSAAGVDFRRHAVEGIDPCVLAWRLLDCQLMGYHINSPKWVTFAGWYDWGYLLKLLTGGPMPATLSEFEITLASFCPRRYELRDSLPHGSLDSLMGFYGVSRVGQAHQAGSDALATLELFFRVERASRCRRTGEMSLNSRIDNGGVHGIQSYSAFRPQHSVYQTGHGAAAVSVAGCKAVDYEYRSGSGGEQYGGGGASLTADGGGANGPSDPHAQLSRRLGTAPSYPATATAEPDAEPARRLGTAPSYPGTAPDDPDAEPARRLGTAPGQATQAAGWHQGPVALGGTLVCRIMSLWSLCTALAANISGRLAAATCAARQAKRVGNVVTMLCIVDMLQSFRMFAYFRFKRNLQCLHNMELYDLYMVLSTIAVLVFSCCYLFL